MGKQQLSQTTKLLRAELYTPSFAHQIIHNYPSRNTTRPPNHPVSLISFFLQVKINHETLDAQRPPLPHCRVHAVRKRNRVLGVMITVVLYFYFYRIYQAISASTAIRLATHFFHQPHSISTPSSPITHTFMNQPPNKRENEKE